MKNRITTHFYVKESKKDSEGLVPIYLRIIVNGERAEISTNKKVNPDDWDKVLERVAGRTEPARIINTTLNNIMGKVEKYFSNPDIKDDVISVYQIITELKGKSQNQMTLIKAYEIHISTLEKLVGVDYVARTVNRYKSSLNNLRAFILQNLNKSDVALREVDKSFIGAFDVFLKSTKRLNHNTAAKHLKNLSSVLNKAVSYNWIPQNPCKGLSFVVLAP